MATEMGVLSSAYVSQGSSLFHNEDYDSSPPSCAELDYLDIHSQPGDMRYTQEANTSALAIEPSQPPALLNLYHPTGLAGTTQYTQDNTAFYQPVSQVFPGLDVRPRVNSNTPSTGMAQAHHQQHRTTGLPHLTGQVSTRDLYSPATPSFRRASEHQQHPVRSPSFPGVPLRRLPLSPTPSPLTSYVTPAGRMEAGQFQNRPSATAVPPLMSVQTAGSLQYENGTQIKIDITGTVDKGFFLAEGEWTCYRRNYMTCACSYSLLPHYPNTAVHFIPPGSTQAYQVYGLYMSISAVVADNDQQSIELVQHTPKRDKGPTSKPEKVLLAPKNSVPSHHPGMYNDATSASGARAMYQDGYGGQGAVQPATEHTFERIQFKQATQNNGKRRAAQQYYHLMVELWADLGSSFGSQSSDKYFKIAFRKSEKMIVRGRSPGHYQNEKRRSHSGGPGGSSGTMGGYGSLTGIGEFSSHPGILGGSSSYGTSYDSRGSVYGTPRSHDVPSEATISSEDDKVMANTKGYLYFPGPMYDNSHSRPMEMFGTRNDQETSSSQSSTETKVKSEYDVTPRVFHPPLTENRRHPGPFEGKSTSGGYYPTILSSPTTSLTL